MNTRKIVAATGIAGALLFTSACSAPQATSAAGPPAASAAATPSSTPSPTSKFPYTLPSGLVAKGVANDGKGDYLQTSIADTDSAMQYYPLITDDGAKAHFSESELAEAHKAAVRFIAEEVIDSTLNNGTDVDGWWAAHKDQIHPANHEIMLNDLRSNKDIVARERWMADQPGLSYAHGADTPRVTRRTIFPQKLQYVESDTLQGVMLDTVISYEMAIVFGDNGRKVQPTDGQVSIAVVKDPADGKWKIAGYNTNFNTTEFIIN